MQATPFACNSCGLLLNHQLLRVLCVFGQWQHIILVSWRKYWSYWLPVYKYCCPP